MMKTAHLYLLGVGASSVSSSAYEGLDKNGQKLEFSLLHLQKARKSSSDKAKKLDFTSTTVVKKPRL